MRVNTTFASIPMQIVQQKLMHNESVLISKMSENIQGVEQIKNNFLQEKLTKRFQTVNHQVKRYEVIFDQVESLFSYVRTFMMVGITILAPMAAIYFIDNPQENIGTIVSAIFMFAFLTNGLEELMSYGASKRMLTAHAELYETCLPTSPRGEAATVTADQPQVLKLENIHYSYEGHQVLNQVSITLPPTGLVVLIGESGAGKSTLLKLISGLSRPDSGQIVLGEARPLSAEEIARRSAFVPQDPLILPLTIKANIEIGREKIDELEMKQFIQQKHIQDLLVSLPSLDTAIDQEGNGLSGGQKQLVNLLRATYKRAKVITLDEPTSAMDPELEARVITLLSNLAKERLVVMVTHRVKYLAQSDHIVVMKQGEISEEGTHQSLMENSVYYQQLQQRLGGND